MGETFVEQQRGVGRLRVQARGDFFEGGFEVGFGFGFLAEPEKGTGAADEPRTFDACVGEFGFDDGEGWG